jgi:hypothetical protein
VAGGFDDEPECIASKSVREVARRAAGLTEEQAPRIRFAPILNQSPESINSSIPGVTAAQEVVGNVGKCLGTQAERVK